MTLVVEGDNYYLKYPEPPNGTILRNSHDDDDYHHDYEAETLDLTDKPQPQPDNQRSVHQRPPSRPDESDIRPVSKFNFRDVDMKENPKPGLSRPKTPKTSVRPTSRALSKNNNRPSMSGIPTSRSYSGAIPRGPSASKSRFHSSRDIRTSGPRNGVAKSEQFEVNGNGISRNGMAGGHHQGSRGSRIPVYDNDGYSTGSHSGAGAQRQDPRSGQADDNSRLVQMQAGYQYRVLRSRSDIPVSVEMRRMMKEKEERMTRYSEAQGGDGAQGGMLREFFKERRQGNGKEPIQDHYQQRRAQYKSAPNSVPSSAASSRVSSRGSNAGYLKNSAGRDRAHPLQPIGRRTTTSQGSDGAPPRPPPGRRPPASTPGKPATGSRGQPRHPPPPNKNYQEQQYYQQQQQQHGGGGGHDHQPDDVHRMEAELNAKIRKEQQALENLQKQRAREEEEEQRRAAEQRRRQAEAKKREDANRRRQEAAAAKRQQQQEAKSRQPSQQQQDFEEEQRRYREEVQQQQQQHSRPPPQPQQQQQRAAKARPTPPPPKARAPPRAQSQRRQPPPSQTFSSSAGPEDDLPVVPGPSSDFYAQAALEDEGGASVRLKECPKCHRKFAEDRLKKHVGACSEGKKARKQFDVMKMRVQGTEHERGAKKNKNKTVEQIVGRPKKSNWRSKHEEFQAMIQYNKKVKKAEAQGGEALRNLPPPPASDTSDYTQCPHCGRKFSPAAADRHIPKCAQIKSNKAGPGRRR